MNKHPIAVALKYDEVNAPKLNAKGEGDIANAIIDIAEAHGVPLYQNSDLVKLLSTLELGEEIPETLYLVIAEIIAFAFHLQGKMPKDYQDDTL